jgi:hypothetical protein
MMIARIKCQKREGYVEAKFDDVWQYIKDNYRKWRDIDDIMLLYLTKRFVAGETSLIVDSKDADVFHNFLKTHILPLECVSGVHMFNLMKPRFFEIPRGTCLDLNRFTVTISAAPGSYANVYESVSGIKPTKSLVVSYIAYTFSDHGSDIVVSVLAKGLSSAKKGVLEHIDALNGVHDTDIVRITRTKKLYREEKAKEFKGIPHVSDEVMGIEMF